MRRPDQRVVSVAALHVVPFEKIRPLTSKRVHRIAGSARSACLRPPPRTPQPSPLMPVKVSALSFR